MTDKNYDPQPVFTLIADMLMEAIKEKDWDKVEKIYEKIKRLAEKK